MTQAPPDGIVTLREVYALIEKTRAELGAELTEVKAHVDTKFTEHNTEHRREADRRSSLYRWAVTTILTVVGVGAAIVIPLVTK